MEEQLKRMYFFATKDHNFSANQTSNKYLPLKNNTISYQSLFDVSKNINQLKITLDGGKTIRGHTFSNKNNTKQVSSSKYQKYIKYETHLNDVPTLIAIYKANKKPKSKNYQKTSTDKPSLVQKQQQNSSITIINNPEFQVEQTTNLPFKCLKTESKLSRNKGKQLEQPNLDLYIDQYLQQLLESENVDIRQEIQSDRQKFILKAISEIKYKIQSDNKKAKQQYLVEDKSLNPKLVNGKSKKHTKSNRIEAQQQNLEENNIQPKQIHIKDRKIKDISIEEGKQKRKSKSTQLMPAIDANGVRSLANFRDRKSKNIDQSILNRNGEMSSQLPALPNRKIYSTTPTSAFITKIGRTFYVNELNVLNKTLELQAKNRERAQRFFKRKLLNIENQYNRVLDKEKRNEYAYGQELFQKGQIDKSDKKFSSYNFY